MSAFTLLGKIGLDTTGFTRGLAGMKNAAGPAAAQIGTQIRGKILEAFGAGAALAIFKSTLQKAFEIQKEAGKSGINTEEYQALKLVADQTGESIDTLAEKLRVSKLEGGGFADEVRRAADELLAMGNAIPEETIQSLANSYERIQSIVAKLAPAIATGIEMLDKFLNQGSRGMEILVGEVQEAYGRYAKKPELIQAGLEMQTGLTFDGQPSSSESKKSAIQSLRERIAEERRLEQEWEDMGGNEAQKSSKKKDKPKPPPYEFQHSALTQIGGYMSPAVQSRRRVDADVAEIKRYVANLITIYRNKE